MTGARAAALLLAVALAPRAAAETVVEYDWPARPLRDHIAVFRGTAGAFYLMPTRLELTPRPDGTPGIGVQYAGYGASSSGRLVSVSASLRFRITADALKQVSDSLKEHLGPIPSPSPAGEG